MSTATEKSHEEHDRDYHFPPLTLRGEKQQERLERTDVSRANTLNAKDAPSNVDGDERDLEKDPEAEDIEQGAAIPAKVLVPWKYRLTAIVLIILFGTGNTYAGFVLPPLKTRLVHQLHITNAQYSVIASAQSLINTLLPIIGGSAIDRYGGSRIALGSAFLCVVGMVLSSCSSVHNQYKLIVAGEIVLGFGSAVQEICRYKLYPHWFTGSYMGLIFGIDIAWNRLIQLIARVTAVPMADIGPGTYWGWALWIPTITTAASSACVYAYYIFENRLLPDKYRPQRRPVREDKSLLDDWLDTIKGIWKLPKFFWLMNVTQMMQVGATRVWLQNITDIQVKSRHTSQQAAGYNASIQSIIPVILTPATGLFFDRIGYRMVFVSAASIFWIIVWALAGFTQVNFLAPVLIASFPFVVNLMPFMATVSILVPTPELVGTAFGIYQSFQNAGTLIMSVSSGILQDNTPGQQYDRVMLMIMVFKAFDTFMGPLYDYLDGRWLGHQLRLPERKRRDALVQKKLAGRTFEGHKRSSLWTYIGIGVLAGMVVAGWVLFILYALPHQ